MSHSDSDSSNPEAEPPQAVVSCPVGELLAGSVFENGYAIIAKLGSGVSATAYKALDQVLERLVVIKVIHSQLLTDAKAIQRFKNEAAASIKLSHANIVRIFKQGQTEDGRLYMVMDYVEGEMLSALLLREGKLPLDIFFNLFAQIIEALSYAHEHSVIHRDIKPANILVSNEEGCRKALLIDFGLARFADGNSGLATQTSGNSILGTSAYMSPEQCQGNRNMDSRADIYSLACVMHECLVGMPPFQGDSDMAIMYRQLNEPFNQASLKDQPRRLAKLISKCLEKDNSQRYQSMAELGIEFDRCGKDLEQSYPKAKLPALSSKHFIIPALILAGALLMLGLSQYQKAKPLQDQPVLQQPASNLAAADDPRLRIPRSYYAFIELADRYSTAGNQKNVQLIIERWIKQYDKKPDVSEAEKVAIYTYAVGNGKILDDLKQVEHYAQKISATTQAQNSYPNAASILASMYADRDAKLTIRFVDQTFEDYHLLADMYYENSSLLGSKGQALVNLGKYKDACEILERSDRLATKLEYSNQIYINPHRYQLIFVWLKLHKKADIEGLIQRIYVSTPDFKWAETGVSLSEIYANCGYWQESLNCLQKARLHLKSATKQDRQSLELRIWQGLYVASMKIKDYASAAKYQKEVIAKSQPEKLADEYYRLSIVYAQAQATKERTSTIEEGLQKIKQQNFATKALRICEFQEELAKLYLEQKRYREAKQQFFNAIDTASRNHDPKVMNSAKKMADLYSELKAVLNSWLAESIAQRNNSETNEIKSEIEKLNKPQP